MKRYLISLALIIVVFLLYSQQCDDKTSANLDIHNCNNLISDIYNCNYNNYNDSISATIIRDRALLMGSVEWIPKSDVPNNSGYFSKGEVITGLPYSSVKELQKFIGLDVSIYTFLTAVENPYSLLYTENVARGNTSYLGGTYNGKNSHTFYGTVCSSFTAFCYGENNNYTSFNYRNGRVPNYYLKPDQRIENLSAGDLFWCPGHVALITDVAKDSTGKIMAIELFESAGRRVQSTIYSPSELAKRVSANGNSKKRAYFYRNKLVEQSDDLQANYQTDIDIHLVLNNLPIKGQEICTWFGDKPCIGEWDKMLLNFRKGHYNKIVVSLNDEIVDTLDISNSTHSIEYKLRGKGFYKAWLTSESNKQSNNTSFEVIDTETKIFRNNEGKLEVIFAQNSNPEILYWVNKSGEQYTYPVTISEKAKSEGRMVIEPYDQKGTSLRVIYRGKYGRAINKPHHLFNKP